MQSIPEDHPVFRDYVLIAQIIKLKGFDGTCIVDLESDDDVEDFLNVKAYFMLYNGNMLPFYAASIVQKDQLFYIKFDNIGDRDFFTQINPRCIFIHKSESSINNNSTDIDVLNTPDMQCYNGDQYLGKLIALEEYPQQTMAIIDYNRKEILVPMVEGLLDKIDYEQNRITFVLPEGFLDI